MTGGGCAWRLTDAGLAASTLVERALTEELAAQLVTGLATGAGRAGPFARISCSEPSPRSKSRLLDRAGRVAVRIFPPGMTTVLLKKT